MNVLVSILVVLLTCYSSQAQKHKKILLQDIDVLTLRHGKMTSGRRSSPVPQAKCIGGSAMGMYNPPVIQCLNRGFDGEDVQWECKSDMDNSFRFGEVTVVCEGYDYPEDPYVLVGSCGVEYTLELTSQGRQQQNHNQKKYQSSYSSSYDSSYNSYGRRSSSGDWLSYIIVGLILYALYNAFFGTANGNFGGGQGYGGGGGYGGGYGGGHGGGGGGGPGCAPPPSGTGGGGGFWSGLLTGGLLSSLFGGRGYNGWGGMGGYNRFGYGGYGRNYGMGFGNRGAYRPAGGMRFGGGGFGGMAAGGGGGGGGGSRTASGFGGTRRR
eukprot:m.114119 g.114119  ORF g.114119 m.114119 type:complete len:323 (-) comp14153_c0_seq5:3771-4739(-)